MSTARRSPIRVHGTCVAIDGQASLLRGASGAGKSDLALRFLGTFRHHDPAKSAALVSDDQTQLELEGYRLMASAPPAIAGQLEVRGIGVVNVPVITRCELRLVADLVEPEEVPRMPGDPPENEIFLGIEIPRLLIDPFEASAPLKLKLALAGSL